MFIVKLKKGVYLTIDVTSGQVGSGAKSEAMVFGDVAGAEAFAFKQGFGGYEVITFEY